MRIGLLQLAAELDPAPNLALIRAALAHAESERLDLLVLPEYATSFDPRGPHRVLAADAAVAAATIQRLCPPRLTVLFGSLMPGSEPGGRAVNELMVVRGGQLLGSYRKIHLYSAFGSDEARELEPGSPHQQPLIWRQDGLTFGAMACYDLRFPEVARWLVDAGAQVIVVPAAWAAGPGKVEHWRTLLRARAIENVAYVVGAGMAGRGVIGHSFICDPNGLALGELDSGAREAIALTCTFDAASVAEARVRNPSLRNRRFEVRPQAD